MSALSIESQSLFIILREGTVYFLEKDLRRESLRLKRYDYRQSGYYYVTPGKRKIEYVAYLVKSGMCGVGFVCGWSHDTECLVGNPPRNILGLKLIHLS